MQTTLEKLGRAQGKMIIARFNGNKELEEHYYQVQVEIIEDMALNRGNHGINTKKTAG